jgi:thioredoxin 1
MKKYLQIVALLICINACAQNPSIKTIKVAEYSAATATDTTQIIDVRTADEYAGGHINYAKNMDQAEDAFDAQIQTLDKTKPTYIYCLSGGRSKSAAGVMAKAGFTNIINLDGGIMAWRNERKTLVINHNGPVSMGMSLDEYNAAVSKKNTLVEFYAVWCGPCKVLKPIVEQIASENKEKLNVIFIDVDKNKMLADSLHLASIPVLKYYEKGKKCWDTTGLVSRAKILKKLKL